MKPNKNTLAMALMDGVWFGGRRSREVWWWWLMAKRYYGDLRVDFFHDGRKKQEFGK